MYYSELVKGEKLMYPIEPDVIRRADSVYVSMRAASSSVRPIALVEDQLRNVLTVDRPGLVFRVYHECSSANTADEQTTTASSDQQQQPQWFWAQSMTTNECGLLPSECVKRVVSFTNYALCEQKKKRKFMISS